MQRGIKRMRFVIFISSLALLTGIPCPAMAETSSTTNITSATSQEEGVAHQIGLPSVVGRSWYGTSFTVNDSYRIRARYFDGSNVGIEFNASCQTQGTLTIRLYRGSSLIGSTTVSNKGFSKSTWNSVGAGNYAFVVISNNKRRVDCTNVAIYSW